MTRCSISVFVSVAAGARETLLKCSECSCLRLYIRAEELAYRSPALV